MEVFVVFSLFLAILFGRNDYLHALLSGLIYNRIAIITAIGKKVLSLNPFNQI